MPVLKWKHYTGKEVTQVIDESQATARRISRLVIEDRNNSTPEAKRTQGLVTAKLCPTCHMLDDHCPTCGGRGVVPDAMNREEDGQ